MAKFRVKADWNGIRHYETNEVVEAIDAPDALSWATPSYRIGDYDRVEITIYRVPDDTPPVQKDEGR